MSLLGNTHENRYKCRVITAMTIQDVNGGTEIVVGKWDVKKITYRYDYHGAFGFGVYEVHKEDGIIIEYNAHYLESVISKEAL